MITNYINTLYIYLKKQKIFNYFKLILFFSQFFKGLPNYCFYENFNGLLINLYYQYFLTKIQFIYLLLFKNFF